MIDNTILAGGAAVAPEITVDSTGLITATAGDKKSTLQQETGAFSYSPAGDAFYTSPGAYLAAQGFMPNLPAFVVDRKIEATNIAVTTHAFPMGDGSTMTLSALAIPLTYSVLGGDRRNIVSYSVTLFGTDSSGNSGYETIIGPFTAYSGLLIEADGTGQVDFDVSGKMLYVAATLKSIPTGNPGSYCVVYRNR